jgi:hypothetical protein
MNKNQLPMDYTSDEELGQVRRAIDSGDGGAHVPRERVTPVEARPASKYVADDSSNSVQITLAHFSTVASAAATSASAVAVDPQALPGPLDEDAVYDPELDTELEASDSKLAKWLLAAGVVSVATFFSALYTIRNPEWVPSFVGQTVQMSEQLSADIKRRASTALGGTAVTDTAKAPLAARTSGSSSGANRTLASDRDENGPRENSSRLTHNGKNTATSNAGDASSGGGMKLAANPQSKPTIEMPKAVKAKTSKSKKGYMVPPPPPTPVYLSPGFRYFGMQPAQQHEAQASPAAGENMLQRPMAKAEPHTPAVIDADKDLNEAVNRSLHTMRQWTR